MSSGLACSSALQRQLAWATVVLLLYCALPPLCESACTEGGSSSMNMGSSLAWAHVLL